MPPPVNYLRQWYKLQDNGELNVSGIYKVKDVLKYENAICRIGHRLAIQWHIDETR